MTSVAAGSRLLVRGAGPALVLRSLRSVDLHGGWIVPVIGDVTALQAAGLTGGTTVVEFPTDAGPMKLDAELVQTDRDLVLRAPGLRPAAFVEQRRVNVRGIMKLPVRGTILSDAAASTRSQAVADTAGGGGAAVDLHGITDTISGGGFSADLSTSAPVAPGTKIYVELGLPGGDLAPAVMTVLAHEGPRVRAAFVDISALDRERLVRMVFARQRAELAERRSSSESRG